MENKLLLVSAPFALAILLAMSPMILLGGGSESAGVTSADLTLEQISTLESLDLARNPSESREGKTTISDVVLIEGSLHIAGTWESASPGFENQTNRGGRDGFIATVDEIGNFQIEGVFGSSGDDSILDLESDGVVFIVRGFTSGDIEYHSGSLTSESRVEAYEGRMVDGEWIGFWHIDSELIESMEERIWCGF